MGSNHNPPAIPTDVVSIGECRELILGGVRLVGNHSLLEGAGAEAVSIHAGNRGLKLE